MATKTKTAKVERVQLGARLEKRMVRVLKGIAELDSRTLGQVLEEIVLHSFEPVRGHEGEYCVSPWTRKALNAIAGLKQVYGMDYDTHDCYLWKDSTEKSD
jgi:hypothetical protein